MSQKVFGERLDQLKRRLLEMSSSVEGIVQASMDLALEGAGSVDKILKLDLLIDAEEVGIEEETIELLALHQPMAGDLRLLVTILKINSDLERIGDHAVNIAEAADRLRSTPRRPAMPPELSEMSGIALGMLRDALDALVHRNAAEAQDVRKRDDRVDRLHESVFRVMLTHMLETDISACLQVILIGRNLERVADLAENIAEDVVFMVEGVTVRHGGGEWR
ncbi:MAG: phosphate signaling complex protein PhoU [Gemmatimonadales bacterium]|nr:MAG: phosphate signaling complex protein PhoU [Gemmatimonadales bacterium]